ncbi:hypothetical protein TCAL_00088 [Tigriopus californicus]|uniref:Protein CASP n=1 Tax=Tigriopus californicus TaxID=6832 RepID=A0A553PHN9_TIGCA|nr:protein CASP-like [Tigriopus californicus]TRY77201.1 hypothetical protein TCAL_00088 [Tigriopus californicus]|eukprot:TCALIF_00088-PA protein Name:"Similar to Cux1 Protein CASP (Mus musculus)" AED:0.01 eAED:0.01 QI:0/-1/0/1/-1/1/1/0/669
MASSKLQGLTQFWQAFDLPSVQGQLDEVATDITARQDASDVSKKSLIDLTREFKKSNDEETRSAVAPLIKSFQNEVDALSKRSKAAEKAFFDLYKKLADVADPVPVLEHTLEAQKSLSKLQDYEIETKQLRETIQDYNKEIQDYKVKEKKLTELQAKVEAYDRNIDQTLQERIKDVSERMLEEYNGKLRRVEEDKAILAARNEETSQKYHQTQRQLNEVQTELFEALSKREESRNAKSEEVDILMNDLETCQIRANTAEREIDHLRDELKHLKKELSDREQHMPEEKINPDLMEELESKKAEVKQLMDETNHLKEEKERDKVKWGDMIEEHQIEIHRLRSSVESMSEALSSQSDYESIKRDLEILQSHEFPNENLNLSTKRPLEVMILEKSKVLQAENANLRIDRDKIANELELLRNRLEETSKEAETKGKLASELEEHVARLQQISTVNRGEAEGRSSADILVDALDLGSDLDYPPSSTTPLDGEYDSSVALLPIVQAQRERYRQRNEELEESFSKQSQQLVLLQNQVQDLQSDNVKLYEKIRYLQGYGGHRDALNNQATGSVESRYKTQYDQKMDPFSSFSQQEKQKRYGQLNVFEKIILSFVQIILSNKTARLFVFAYSMLLHGLVFMVLMKLAYSDANRRDLAAEWHEKYMNHMEDVHGHQDNHG